MPLLYLMYPIRIKQSMCHKYQQDAVISSKKLLGSSFGEFWVLTKATQVAFKYQLTLPQAVINEIRGMSQDSNNADTEVHLSPCPLWEC